jgi:hypothetical protein
MKLGVRALTGLMWCRSGYGVGVMWTTQRTVLFVKEWDFLTTRASVGVSRWLRPPWGYISVVTKQKRNRITIHIARFGAWQRYCRWSVSSGMCRHVSGPSLLLLAQRHSVIPLKTRIRAATVFNAWLPGVHFEVFCLSFVCVFLKVKVKVKVSSP